ncbi:hypothetical protein [Nocardia arthritidis]|uniref:Uncharacterized protein n=1 Tax=Nocardia arthritidis TaxID=228602 RepID=A0A6G9Y9F8_9NOCA|nr:hypothetical protein [Nocardia arthritidis]QIS09851.1 hypothetical protein F5544_09755 [Nocardia arthritidis]
MTTREARRGTSYLAAFAILADPARPHETPKPSSAEFDTLYEALTWLHDRAHDDTSASGPTLAAAAVYARSAGRQKFAPIRRFGVGTGSVIADIIRTMVTTTRAAQQPKGRMRSTAGDPATEAAQALDHALAGGISIQFTDPAEPSRILTVGLIDREWTTVEHRQDHPRGSELREIGRVGVPHYARVTDMLGDLAIGAPYLGTARVGQHLPAVTVPADIVEDLCAFQARLDALAARARICACDHPEILAARALGGAVVAAEPETAAISTRLDDAARGRRKTHGRRHTAGARVRRKARL